MDRGRGDRPGIPGLRVATGGGDLIEDIHRQQRRRLLKRAAQLTALAIALLLIGVAFKIVKDRRARAHALEAAYGHFVRGTPPELEASVQVLDQSIEDVGGEDPDTLAARALAYAHLWAEFGIGEQEARDAVEAVPGDPPGAALAEAILAFVDGDVDAAVAGLEQDRERAGDEDVGAFVASERIWMDGRLAVARSPDDPEALGEVITALRERLEQEPEHVAIRRQLVLALLLSGAEDEALAELATAREHAPTHMGLSADDALYNAYLRQKLSGVASVADQLLEVERPGLSRHDRAHAQLARAVVHVQSGEHEEGLTMLDRAWEGLPRWDRMSRRLAIRSALEAGNAERIDQWVEDTPLPEPEGDIYRAWAVFVRGDVMGALRRLADLPQADPWVGYLQALALVEQGGREAEARPWVERTEKLLPGRVEIEVARARMELHLGDKKVALRKLEALAQEEPWAPRAWTGLGEAHLMQEEPDLAEARKALQRAIDREPHPAEAMLQLARLYDQRRDKDADAIPKAKELLEKAAKANPYLPRYREELALYLADIGYPDEAIEHMKEVVDEPGIGWEIPLRLAKLQVEEQDDFDPEPLLEKARERGAPPDEILVFQAELDADSGDRDRVAKAQQELEALLERSPKNVEARIIFAQTYMRQFDRKTAESILRRGIAALDSKTDGRLLHAWAEIEARSAKTRKAAPRARKAWQHMLDEDLPPVELLDVADLATRLWLKLGKERQALSIAEQLTDRLGYHSMAWTIRARTELNGGEASAARDSAQKAIELDENNPRAHEIYGHSLLRYGIKDKAKAAYERAVELVEGTPQEAEYRDNFKRL